MEKKRVRIYKAEQGGSMMNPLSDFITKAQYGQQQQVDPQQLVMQTVSAIAPAELGGQGNDPNDVYMKLAQTHGQEMASSIINAAVGYIQQMTSGAQSEQAQSTEPVSDQLSIQEELIAQERERQRIMQEQMAEQEDDDFMNELLYGEAKEGGSLDKMKKQYVKSAVKLAKKQLGDAGTNNEQPVDSTDIREGRNSKVSNFLTSVQNNAYLSQVEKQAENMFMQQFGGNVSPDLYKYVYGGYDPSIPELTMAQNGITVTDKWGNTKQMSQEDADYWNQMSSGNPDLRLTDFSLASDAPKQTTSENLTDQQKMFLNAGKAYGYPTQGYYPNYIPYSTDNFFNSVIPYNRGQKRTVMGQGRYDVGSLPFSPYFGPDLSGFEVKKERLGLGSKKYTYRPLYGTDTPESSDELTKDKRERQGPFSNLGEKLKYRLMKEEPGVDRKVKGITSKGWLGNIKKAQEGLQKFQGNEQGNQVNNQNQTIPELKPKSSKEVWQTTRPEIMQSWGVQDIQSGEDLLKDWEMETFEMKEFDPQQALLAKNVIGSGIASIGSSPLFDKGARQAKRDAYTGQTMDNIAADTFYTQPGTYFTNAEAAFRGKKPGAPQGEGFEAIVKYGGPIMAKGGTPYPQRFGSLQITPTAMGGNDIDQYIGKKGVEVKDSISAVPREDANLEAEGGETAYGDINGDGFPEHYKINGPRHTEGGVPLNLPDGTFIFSDTRSMKITDCNILKMFNKPCGKGGFTPATLAKPYDINSYRKILQDPTSDQLDKKTAELMIKQYVLKLGALALAQESKKGFPQGIPEVARPYMEAMGIKDEDLLPKDPNATEGTPQEMDMMAMTSEEGMPAEDEMMEQPMAQLGQIVKGAKQLGRIANPFNTINTLAKTVAPIMINPIHFPTFGMALDPDIGIGPFTGNPLNILPIGKKLEGDNSAFRKFGDTLDYVKFSRSLDPSHGPLLRLGKSQTAGEGNWAAPNKVNEAYPGVFAAEFNTAIPGSNLGYKSIPNRRGVLITDAQGNRMPKISIDDPGLFLKRRVPFLSDRYIDIDMDKLRNDEFDWRTMGGNAQAMAERYGYAAGLAGLAGAAGFTEPQEYLDEYVTDPIMNFTEGARKTISEFMENPFNYRKQDGGEQMPMAMYGMTMGGYDLPFVQETPMEIFQRGGQLAQYQNAGEVKKSTKVYTKTDLPENAVIKTEKDAWNIQPGDFVLQSDGTYRKVLTSGFNPQKVAVDTGTQKQTVQEFIAKSPENKQIIDKANAIIKKGIDDKTITCLDKSCSQIRITGKFNPPFKDRIILSRALNSNINFGTDKYTVKKQSYTPGYEGKGAFVAGFTPEEYEKRFIFEKAKGAGNTDDEAFAIVDQVYADPKLKAKFRKDYLTMLGVPNIPTTDEELLKPDFYKTRYADVTKGMESVLTKDFARPAIGDDALSGFEHFDAFGFSPELKYEYSPYELENKQTIVSGPGGDMIPVNIPVPKYAPWWLQDTIGTAGAAIRMFSRQDQFPPSFRVDYEEPRGPFLDPARELAAQSESSNKMINYLSKFAGPQNLVNIASNIMGQDSKVAADILSKYNNANTQLARQDDYAGLDIRNREADNRMKAAQAVVDATNKTIAGRQNTRLADMKYLEDQLKSAITNRWMTDTVNQMYLDFAVDPSVGGKLIKTPNYKNPSPTKSNNLDDYYSRFYDLTDDKEQASKLAMFQYNKDKTGASTNNDYPIEAIMSMYNREYGGELPEAQTGLIKLAGNMLSKVPGISRMVNPTLARFTGSSLAQIPQSDLVRPLGSQTPVSLSELSELSNLQDAPEYLPELQQDYPVMQAGFIPKLPGLPASITDIGESLGSLAKYALPTLGTPSSINPESLSSMGTVTDPKSITDDELLDLIAKIDFTQPVEQWMNNLHPTELLVLKANKDRINVLKDTIKQSKGKAKGKTVTKKPKAPVQPISKDELNETALELYGMEYKNLTDAQMMDVISYNNFKKIANPPKKTRTKKPKTETVSAPQVNTDMITQTREKLAMDYYGESYETLTGLAKKMIDNEVQKLLGSETPPFQSGGIFVMGSNVFPPMFY